MRLCYHCMTQIENDKDTTCPKCGKSLEQEPVAERYLKPGTELQNKFIVGYPIGAGGFGNTYIGLDKLLLRKVAIKEFYPEQYVTRSADGLRITVQDESLMPRFRKGLQQFIEEARSVARLHDIKGVVEITNFFEENGTGYIIMEYLEGMDVKTILKKSGNKKDYEWCRRVTLTVLHTLREIHKQGILHRDIAPDNIFVTYEGVIKLIDFGAARHATALANMKQEIILKVGYAPIEQYSREAPQGPYTDLYAVAALFYRMITGQKPLPANERLNNDSLITPSEMGISIPEQAEMAMMVCLNVQPQYRLQSADEFMDALDGKNFVPVYEPEWILPPVEEKKSFSNMPVPAKVGIIMTIICLLGLVTFGIVHIANSGSGLKPTSDENILADFSGMAEEDVVVQLEESNINDCNIIYQLSSEPYGTVLEQEPKAGEIPEGEDITVTLYVSGGDIKYTLEKFTGKGVDEIKNYFQRYNFQVYESAYPGAEATLTDNGSESTYAPKSGIIRLVREYSDDFENGICYSQSMSDGEECDCTEEITFAISCGKVSDYEIAIPNLTGKKKKAVSQAIEEAGLAEYLEVQFADESITSSVDKGKVAEQSLPEGYVYNTLERKTYRYDNGARVDEQASTAIVVTLSAGSGAVTPSGGDEPQPSTTEAAAWD